MGIELELVVLLIVSVLGSAIFAPFELETPAWRKVLKWGIVIGITLGLAQVAGHWALLVPALGATVGITGHTVWCRRNGIHPLHATPRRKYYALRGWTWRE